MRAPLVDPFQTDVSRSVVYCVCTTLEANSTYHHRLHIVDIRTGVKRAGSGVAVASATPDAEP